MASIAIPPNGQMGAGDMIFRTHMYEYFIILLLLILYYLLCNFLCKILCIFYVFIYVFIYVLRCFGPYGVYQEGPSTTGAYTNFLGDAHFQLARFEACGMEKGEGEGEGEGEGRGSEEGEGERSTC